MSDDNLPNMLSIKQFVKHFNVSRGTLYRLWDRGEGPRTVRVGRRVLIPLDRAYEWVRSLEEDNN